MESRNGMKPEMGAIEGQVTGNELATWILLEEFNSTRYNFLIHMEFIRNTHEILHMLPFCILKRHD